ncbi:hypothetical protein INR49_022055 [Caranx melampygus]|nr:hypothetical protein INR49_022055 [Caranx melampygus]
MRANQSRGEERAAGFTQVSNDRASPDYAAVADNGADASSATQPDASQPDGDQTHPSSDAGGGGRGGGGGGAKENPGFTAGSTD